MEIKITTFCGLDCDRCEYKKSSGCKGCRANDGKPFYGECPVAECTKSKNVRFCGECADFPCELLKSFSYDDAHGDTPKGARIEHCKNLKSAMVKQAREGIDPVSCCGHHCDFCFLGQWCGGCRSNYNCCSFATLFQDKMCPNVMCAKEKGIEGCYMCDELEGCAKGYYQRENEYVAKATAIFIKKHGKEIYTKTLKCAIDDGLNYPKSFDKTGSVAGALELLKKYK